MEAPTSSTSSKKPDVAFRSKGEIPVLWNMAPTARAMSQCTSTLREYSESSLDHELTAPSGPDPAMVAEAKKLCESLLDNVREQYIRFKENPPQQRAYGYQQGGAGGGNDRQPSSYANAYGSYPGVQSPTSATAAPAAPPGPPGASSPTDYSAQYAAYYGSSDPYAAYGGYQNYVAYYQYYSQQQQQAQAPGAAPPAPPTDDAAPPPPPPSGSPPAANGGYNAVRPLISDLDGRRGVVIGRQTPADELDCRSRRLRVCNHIVTAD